MTGNILALPSPPFGGTLQVIAYLYFYIPGLQVTVKVRILGANWVPPNLGPETVIWGIPSHLLEPSNFLPGQ